MGEWRGGARKAREKAGRGTITEEWGRPKEKGGSFVETVGRRRAGNRRILKWINKKQETAHIRQNETSNLEVRSITKSSEHWEWFGRAPRETELGNQRDRTIRAPGELVSKDSAQAEGGLDHPEEGLTRQTLQRDLDATGNTVTCLGLAGRR